MKNERGSSRKFGVKFATSCLLPCKYTLSRNNLNSRQELDKESMHQDLQGKSRLYNLVKCLGESCPWTKQMKAKDMLLFLER
jgi:hypothetical protein